MLFDCMGIERDDMEWSPCCRGLLCRTISNSPVARKSNSPTGRDGSFDPQAEGEAMIRRDAFRVGDRVELLLFYGFHGEPRPQGTIVSIGRTIHCKMDRNGRWSVWSLPTCGLSRRASGVRLEGKAASMDRLMDWKSKRPENPCKSTGVGGEVGLEPTVRLPVQRFSSSMILVLDCAAL